jgi:hypothetical protein
LIAQSIFNLWNVLKKNTTQGVGDIADAKEDVQNYAAGGLPNISYGEVPYIFAHAAAGSKVYLGLIMASGEVLAFSSRL